MKRKQHGMCSGNKNSISFWFNKVKLNTSTSELELEPGDDDLNSNEEENIQETVSSTATIQTSGIESDNPSPSEVECVPPHPNQPLNDIPPKYQSGRREFNFQTTWYQAFPWLHYKPELKSIFCHLCMQAKQRGLFPVSMKTEPAFLEIGFRNWKRASELFKGHQKSNQHMMAVTKLTSGRTSNIQDKLERVCRETYRQNRLALLKICSSLKYLARQGLPIQGDKDSAGNFIQLLHLRAEEVPFLKSWLNRSRNFTSHDIQNEILGIMAMEVLRKKIEDVKSAKLFSLIVDETTDISTKEQMCITLRHVDENLNPRESFMGMYEMDCTTGEALTSAILDVLRRFDLPVSNIRGQCFDGGSNMRGNIRGVQARIREMESRAVYVHCYNHSLNLALQDSIRKIPLMRDALQYVNDVAVVIGRSAKRLSMFENIAQELGYTKVICLKSLCPTRWSVRVKALKTILVNYPVLLQALQRLTDSKDPCSATASGLMRHFERYETLFGIMTLLEFFTPCENLACSLQSPSATLTGSIESANLLILHLESMLNYSSFETLLAEADSKSTLWELNPPSLPRKRTVPSKLKSKLPAEEQFKSVQEYLYNIYKNTLESLIEEVKQRFSQKCVEEYGMLEKILTDEQYINQEDVVLLMEKYEIDFDQLKCQLKMFRTSFQDVTCFKKCLESFLSLGTDTRKMFSELDLLFRLLVVIPSSSAAAERSFSMLRRVKTYLRSTMSQQRLNHLCLLHAYQEEVDGIQIEHVVNEFISKCSTRISTFGNV